MSNSIAPGSSADVNVKVTALTTNPNVPVTYKTIILKKNLVNGINTLTQEMMSAQNTKYVVKYDYVLGEDITVPANCVLEFDGGSISASGSNDTITGANTSIQSGLVKIFNTDVTLAGTWNIVESYPEWFGAVGDGITDDIIPLQKTFNTFNVIKLKHNYAISNTLYIIKSDSIIDGEFHSIVPLGDINRIIQFNGNFDLLINTVDKDIEKGSNFVIFDNVSNIAVGDILTFLSSEVYHQDNSDNVTYKKGEIQTVLSIDNNKVYFEDNFETSYTISDNTINIYKITPTCNVVFRNVEVKGSGENTEQIINLEKTKNVTIDNIIVYDACCGIGISNSISTIIQNSLIRDLLSWGYGVEIGCARNSIITNNKIYNVRHAFTTIGDAAFAINSIISNNIINYTRNYALDTHDNSINTQFINNIISTSSGAVTTRGKNTSIINNLIKRASNDNQVPTIFAYELGGYNIKVIGNVANGDCSTISIRHNDDITEGYCSIENNTWENCTSATFIEILNKYKNIVVSNNTVNIVGYFGIDIRYAVGNISIVGNTIRDILRNAPYKTINVIGPSYNERTANVKIVGNCLPSLASAISHVNQVYYDIRPQDNEYNIEITDIITDNTKTPLRATTEELLSMFMKSWYLGAQVWNKTINKPVFWQGSKWVLADGSDMPTS